MIKPADTTTGKNFDKVAGSDDKSARKELVDQLMFSLQSSLGDTLSPDTFIGIVDNVSNALFTMSTYATSLKNAADEIQANFPEEGSSDDLSEVSDIAGALVEGAARTTQYIDVVRKFGSDLDAIQSELYSKLQNLHSET